MNLCVDAGDTDPKDPSDDAMTDGIWTPDLGFGYGICLAGITPFVAMTRKLGGQRGDEEWAAGFSV
jgi:hypothetical protein